jgi:hypothetical protein
VIQNPGKYRAKSSCYRYAQDAVFLEKLSVCFGINRLPGETHKNTQTPKHQNTKTQKHKNTKTQKHKNTKTPKHQNPQNTN